MKHQRKRMQRWQDIDNLHDRIAGRDRKAIDDCGDECDCPLCASEMTDQSAAVEINPDNGMLATEKINGQEYRLAGICFDKDVAGYIGEILVPLKTGMAVLRERRLVSNGSDEVVTYKELPVGKA